jgi:TolB protein
MRAVTAAVLIVLIGAGASAEPNVGRIAYLGLTGGIWQVWHAAADGSDSRPVTRSSYDKTRCSWFPDGEHLLVNGIGGELVKVAIATGAESPIELSIRGTTDAVLSPDGQSIAFSVSTAGSIDDHDIWVARADGTNPKRMASMPYLQHEPAWSLDGRWIYFLSGDGTQAHDVWRIDVHGSKAEQLTVGSLYHFELAPGPEGRLAYSSNRSGNYEIYVQNGTAEAKPVAEHPALDGHPSWSPDGAALVFHSLRSGKLGLWRAGVAGNNATQLPVGGEAARAPVWQRSAP